VSGPIDQRPLERIDAHGRVAARDAVVVEAALEVRCGGEPRAIVLRTPGHDVELVRGLLFAEGVLRADEALVRQLDADAVAIDLDPAELDARWPRRALSMTSACGACGKPSVDTLAIRAQPIASALTAPASLLADLPSRMAQPIFDATGGLHGAALFSPTGSLLATREDVGRHNAVDKLIGWALAAGVATSASILCVSSRLGYEIAQKAIVASIPIVVAVSAPSSLAIDLGERFRVALCGFTRGGRLNVYAHPWRVA
jgi:FdhD protein